MIKIKKIAIVTIKLLLGIIVFSFLALFLYSAIFYKPSNLEKENVKNQITEKENKKKDQERIKIEEEAKNKLQEEEKKNEKKEKEITQEKKIESFDASIKDGLYAVIGNRAITKSDVVNEIKVILILNNMSYSEDKRDDLQKLAVKSIIKRTIKNIAIDKNEFLKFSQNDFDNELMRLANNINMDVDTLRSVCLANGLEFSIIEEQVQTELLWNSLIFALYRGKISINLNEIEEQLKLNQNKKEFTEYLISEIMIESVEKDKLESKIEEIKNRINSEGFENVAMNLSISQTASKGGDLGWINENSITKKFRSEIFNTPIGSLSKPILLNEGILIFKIRDTRKLKNEINLEKLKEQLVFSEKTKILNMYSLSHYDKLRRATSIKFIDE